MRTAIKLSIVFLLCVIVLVKASVGQDCETENAEPGVCVNLDKCFAFKDSGGATGFSAQQLDIIDRERKKCANDEPGSDPVCCRQKPPIKLKWSFEDTKPLEKHPSDVLPGYKICGSYDTDRIYFGNVTDLGQYPWMVPIKYIRDGEVAFDCGGSLINHRYVLTAAHCITSNIYEVRVGEWHLGTDPDCVKKEEGLVCAPPVIDIGIEKIQIHTNFTRRDSQGGKVDMALIRLNQDVVFNEYVRPICLPTSDAEATLKSTQYVSGWGLTENQTTSMKKLFTVVEPVQQDQCIKDVDSPFIKVDDTVICARGKDRRDSCSGDSGGPLMQIGSAQLGNYKVARMFLTGVVSNGLACGTTKPAFYSNVYKQLKWIVSNIAQ